MNSQRAQATLKDPALPTESVSWMLGPTARTVVVASPNSLPDHRVVEGLRAGGHDVIALDRPFGKESLPQLDQSVDALVFTGTLPEEFSEVVRVLRPGGGLCLVRTDRDQRIPWARKLDQALDKQAADADPTQTVVSSGKFGFVSDHEARFWQTVTSETLGEVIAPELAHLDAETRSSRLAAARRLYDDYGRGADGMQLPWVARCLKATVLESAYIPARSLDERGDSEPGEDTQPYQFNADDLDRPTRAAASDTSTGRPADTATGRPADKAADAGPQDGSDSELLLIDFN